MKLTMRGHLLIGVLRRFYIARIIGRVSDLPDTRAATASNRTVARNGSLAVVRQPHAERGDQVSPAGGVVLLQRPEQGIGESVNPLESWRVPLCGLRLQGLRR
jgi:hypothetical protein